VKGRARVPTVRETVKMEQVYGSTKKARECGERLSSFPWRGGEGDVERKETWEDGGRKKMGF